MHSITERRTVHGVAFLTRKTRLGPGWLGLLLLAALVPVDLPFRPRAWSGPGWWYALLTLLFLLAIPGFIACLVADPQRLRATPLSRFWIRFSLPLLVPAVAVFCLGLGALALHESPVLAVVLAIPPIAFAVCSGILLWRFEHTPIPDGPPPGPAPTGVR